MKIIDKQKDYYDYLQGIFGEDPLAVFDRRGSVVFSKETTPLPFKEIPKGTDGGYYGVITLVCGLVYHKIGFKNLPGEKPSFEEFGSFRITRETNIPIRLKIDYSEYRMDTVIVHSDRKYISESDRRCFPYHFPSGKLLHEDEFFVDGKSRWWDQWQLSYKNPILRSLSLVTIPAETIFEELHEFLLSLNDKPIVDSRTDTEKLESAGFDKKTSFRKM